MANEAVMGSDAWDGARTAWAFLEGLARLEARAEDLNRLNVFPIPDADTGTNMSHTVAGAKAALADVVEGAPVGDVLARFARGVLIHARGNSGVILAEVFRGLAAEVRDKVSWGPGDLARGIGRAADYARRAVAAPVEGTILTALQAAAEAATTWAERPSVAMRDVFREAARASRAATDAGPALLSVLREHGVVDAGAFGLTLFLEGVAAVDQGDPAAGASRTPLEIMGGGEMGVPHAPAYGFEVQCLLETDMARASVLAALAPLGESLVVTGEPGLYRVHIHSGSPQAVLEACRRLGTVTGETVDSLDAQVAERHGRGEF